MFTKNELRKLHRLCDAVQLTDSTGEKTSQGYDVLDKFIASNGRIFAVIKRKNDYMVAAGYNTSRGDWDQGYYDIPTYEAAKVKAKRFARNGYGDSKLRDSNEREIVTYTNDILKELGKNNSIGKYDKMKEYHRKQNKINIIRAIVSLFGESFLTGDELKAAIRKEVPRLLKRYPLDDSGMKHTWIEWYTKFEAIANKYFPNVKKIKTEVDKLAKQHSSDPAMKEAYKRWSENDGQ